MFKNTTCYDTKKIWTPNSTVKILKINMNEKLRKNLSFLMLSFGFFFNPLGFDILFYVILQATGSYGLTTFIFYLLSVVSFGLYFYFSNINPLSFLKRKVKKI